MNYTENYQLNQWEQSDRVLMDDFNADNVKLDAALKTNAEAVTALANRSRFTKLKEINITSNTTKITIDLSNVDWSQWDKVHLDMITTNGTQMQVYVNQTTGQYAAYFRGSNGNYLPQFTLHVGRNPNRTIYITMGSQEYSSDSTFSQLTQLIIYGNNEIMYPGARFEVWGEK